MYRKLIAFGLGAALMASASAAAQPAVLEPSAGAVKTQAEAETEVAGAETEAVTEADESTLVMQGTDNVGIIWTLAINTESAQGCVSITPEGEKTTYVYGDIVFSDDQFTITDQEDGNEYVFGYRDISETETVLTYEPTGSEVTLTYVDAAVLKDSGYAYYAGSDEAGNQYTFGFDRDNGLLVIYAKPVEGEEVTVSGTYEAVDDSTIHYTTEDGNEADIQITAEEGTEEINGFPVVMNLTLDGETVEVSYVDLNTLEQ